MAKKVEKKPMTVEMAIALHLATTKLGGIGESFNRLLKEVRRLTGNRLISLKDIKVVVANWVNLKWAKLTNNYIMPIGSGVLHIHNLARSAAAA